MSFHWLGSRLLKVFAAFVVAATVLVVVPSSVGAQSAADITSFVPVDDVDQIEYSTAHELLFLRNETEIEVIDLATLRTISTRAPLARFTDMSMTPDDNYLFVADYAGEATGYGTPLAPHYVHRYEITTDTWTRIEAPKIAWKIEAVRADRVLLQEQDQHVDMTHNSYELINNQLGSAEGIMRELSRVRADYYGDFEYDAASGRIYHGGSGSSSKEIHVRQLSGDTLTIVTDTGIYGTADASGGGASLLSTDGSYFLYGRLQVSAANVRSNQHVYVNTPIAANAHSVWDNTGRVFDPATGAFLGQVDFVPAVGHASAHSDEIWLHVPARRAIQRCVANATEIACPQPAQPPLPKCHGEQVTVYLGWSGSVPTEGPDVILGTDGPDVINGLGGDDIICGGGGDDVIRGGEGRDWISGDAGNDRLFGDLGVDRLLGRAGNDYLDGGGGSDRMYGHEGVDEMAGGSGADRMFGGPDGDVMRGMGGQDFMKGEGGDDLMQGNWQSDTMYGGAGNDEIYGAGGKDELYGESGNDTLSGGLNTDYLNGGGGVDIANGGRGRDKPLIAGESGCVAETIVNCQPLV